MLYKKNTIRRVSLVFAAVIANTAGCRAASNSSDVATSSETSTAEDSSTAKDSDTHSDMSTEPDSQFFGTDSFDTETTQSREVIEADWVTIPAGEFVYGSPESQPCRGDISEEQAQVIITRPYKMASTEITRKQWRTLTGMPDPSSAEACDTCAQGYVSWFDALYWLNTLSRSAGLPECYDLSSCVGTPGGGCPEGKVACRHDQQTENSISEVYTCTGRVRPYETQADCPGYRLPTAAEWEWAARGGTTTATYNGDIQNTTGCLDDPVMNPIGWYCGNSDDVLHPVGELLPNAYGLYDMLGNVGEWSSDVYTGSGLAANEEKEPPLIDPTGELDEGYVDRSLRGGCIDAYSCRSTASTTFPEFMDARTVYTGFRPVRTILD